MRWRSFIVLASYALLATTMSAAGQHADDPSVGTWKLNISKSTFASNTPPKHETRTDRAVPGGIKIVIEDEYADGKKTRVESLITYDGTPRRSTGTAIWDSTATKRINQNVSESDLLRNGQIVGSVRREVSPDGNTMKIVYVIHRPDGSTVSTLSVFDRLQ